MTGGRYDGPGPHGTWDITRCPLCVSMVAEPDNDYTYEVLHAAHNAYIRHAVEALLANDQEVNPDSVVRAMLDWFLRSAIRQDVAAALYAASDRAN